MTMTKTVKHLILELDELHQRHRVWEEIKSFLERKVNGSSVDMQMQDGRHVDGDVVTAMLVDIDAIMGEIEARVEELETVEVTNGKRQQHGEETRRARPSASGNRRKTAET